MRLEIQTRNIERLRLIFLFLHSQLTYNYIDLLINMRYRALQKSKEIMMYCVFDFKKSVYNPLISIIVPVYNTEKYLEQCLNSLKVQTLRSIEILVIDDGSTDNSGMICDRFALDDSRFRVIHKRNEGLSATRNFGIRLASSEYIMFVDSDDWVEPTFCEVPYYTAKRFNADIVIFNFCRYKHERLILNTSFPIEGIVEKEKVITTLWTQVWAAVWNKLFRKELFDENIFPVGRAYEDIAVTHRIIHKSQKIALINQFLYNYRDIRPGSITHNRTYFVQRDYFYYMFQRINDLKEWGYEYKEEEVDISVSYVAIFGKKADYSKHCIDVLNNINRSIFKTSSWKRKAMLVIYRLSPVLFDILSVLTGRRFHDAGFYRNS